MSKLGLIAGNGRFPFHVAKCAREKGHEIIVVGLKDEADPGLEKLADKFYWSSIGDLSKTISILKSENVKQAVMAGQVKHKKLYYKLFLDKRALKILGRIKDKRTDSILNAVADEFKSEGIEFLSSTAFLTDFFPGKGKLTKSKPAKNENSDIAFGFKIAKELAGMDIGQTAIVRDMAVLALEALEGTDECIMRAGNLASKKGEPSEIIIVKVAKPRQDQRFDVPVLGTRTIDSMIKIGARVLAFEAGKTLLLDRQDMISKADKNNICIIGISDDKPEKI